MGWKGGVGAIALSSLVAVHATAATKSATLALSVGPQAPRFNSELWLVRPDGRGRRNHYLVNRDIPMLRHAAQDGHNIGSLLDLLRPAVG